MANVYFDQRGFLNVSGASIGFMNLSGKERINNSTGRVVNEEGKRNFAVFIAKEDADYLMDNGIDVKMTKDPENPSFYVKVDVSYRAAEDDVDNQWKNPVISTIVNGVRTDFTESMVHNLDKGYRIEPESAEIIIRPWTKRTGRVVLELKQLAVVCEPYNASSWIDQKYGRNN